LATKTHPFDAFGLRESSAHVSNERIPCWENHDDRRLPRREFRSIERFMNQAVRFPDADRIESTRG